jgi:hypothetical protein
VGSLYRISVSSSSNDPRAGHHNPALSDAVLPQPRFQRGQREFWSSCFVLSHCKHGGFSGASQKRKYVTQVTYGLGGASYIRNNRRTFGSHVMTSDYTGIVFFAVLGMLIVLSAAYIPA